MLPDLWALRLKSEQQSHAETVSDLLLRKLRCWRWELARRYRVCKVLPLVRAIAERFVHRVPAAAQAYDFPPTQPEGLTFRVDNLKIAFHAQGTVIQNRKFRSRQDNLRDLQ